MRDPGIAPNGQATNRVAVNPARPTYPYATPAPATYNSPTTPTGTGCNHASSTKKPRWANGTPMGLTDAVDIAADDLPERGMHRRLGDAIHVDQPR